MAGVASCGCVYMSSQRWRADCASAGMRGDQMIEPKDIPELRDVDRIKRSETDDEFLTRLTREQQQFWADNQYDPMTGIGLCSQCAKQHHFQLPCI